MAQWWRPVTISTLTPACCARAKASIDSGKNGFSRGQQGAVEVKGDYAVAHYTFRPGVSKALSLHPAAALRQKTGHK
jgi:hypothetical protein